MKQDESWVNKKWRPMMGWAYMFICIYDFVLAPTANYIFFAVTGLPYVAWTPLTMVSGGLFHVAMGAVVGVTSWQRGIEKLKRYEMTDERRNTENS
jgi:hypothetical protein